MELEILIAKGFTIEQAFKDYVEEERRINYVAYTRAKFKLIVFLGQREEALKNATELIFDENKFGITIPSGFEKHYITWGATDSGNNSFDFIHKELKVGIPIKLIKPKEYWLIECDQKRVGCLSKKESIRTTKKVNGFSKLNGFVCSGIYRWTFRETVDYDSTHFDEDGNNRTYSEGWTDDAKRRGYIYIVEFSGYGTPA